MAVASISAEHPPAAEVTAGQQPACQQSIADDGVFECVVMDAPIANTQLHERVATNQDDGDCGASTRAVYVHPPPDTPPLVGAAVPLAVDLLWISSSTPTRRAPSPCHLSARTMDAMAKHRIVSCSRFVCGSGGD